MRYDLATIAKQNGLRRKLVTFSPILMTGAIASQLAAISRRIIAPWLGCKDRVVTAYSAELGRKLQHDGIDELSALFASLAQQVNVLIVDLTPAMQSWAVGVEQWHRKKFAGTILSGANVDVSTVIGPTDAQESIDNFLARQTSLISNVSDEARAKVADAVYRSLQQNVPTRQVGAIVQDILQSSRARANRIAADQATKLASALDAQRQREAGLTVWQWNHSGKLHFRPEHKARDGNLYADDATDRGFAPDGRKIAEPPPKDDLPGVPPFCGCVRQGILILPE